MDLLLWRPAESGEGVGEAMRPLTERGEKHALKVAHWLSSQGPEIGRVVVAPTVAAGQTADCLGLDYEVSVGLSLGGCVSELIGATGWPGAAGNVLLVAHQPAVGRLAALLLSGQEADWTIKKGALWWFSNRVRRGETQTVLRAAITPDLLHHHPESHKRHPIRIAA
ncbi:MAG: histidine phosphatase family protein [Rhodocyclaceae bacterium]|jgi:phosphohistidine phosphatase